MLIVELAALAGSQLIPGCGPVRNHTCWVVDGTKWLGPSRAAPGAAACCRRCAATDDCVAWEFGLPDAGEWGHPGNCSLVAGPLPPKAKVPVHPVQSAHT